MPHGGVLFHWETGRGAACLENIIPVDFSGVLQCDGYEAYDCFAKGRGQIVLAGCMAHVRRKFHEAKEQSPRVAGWILKHLQNLYALEARLRETRAGPALRNVMRASQSQPVLARLHRALIRLKTSHRFLPRSSMGKAIDYALNQWSSLLVYLRDGRLEIDNNLIENSIRPTAIGKNYGKVRIMQSYAPVRLENQVWRAPLLCIIKGCRGTAKVQWTARIGAAFPLVVAAASGLLPS